MAAEKGNKYAEWITEEEALNELDRFSRTLEGDEAQIVLNIARRDTGETKDDEEVSLIKFERIHGKLFNSSTTINKSEDGWEGHLKLEKNEMAT